MREMDRITIEEIGIPGLVLMENAGRGVVQHLLTCFPPETRNQKPETPSVIICGRGNNGGDGIVVARVLHDLGFPVLVFLAGRIADHLAKEGDAARQVRILQNIIGPPPGCGSGLPAATGRAPRDAAGSGAEAPSHILILDETASPGGLDRLDAALRAAPVVVDALLGTGASGPVKPDLADLIARINAAGRPVVAVDLPSGLDADEGVPLGAAVRATVTCTLGLPKAGFCKNQGPACTGEVRVVDIGIPGEVVARVLGEQSG